MGARHHPQREAGRADSTVIVSDRQVRLTPQCVWIDLQALNDRLADCAAVAEGSSALTEALDAALALYRGPCLADQAQPRAATARERLRSRLAVALLSAMRGTGLPTSRGRELRLRAAAADPPLGALLDAG